MSQSPSRASKRGAVAEAIWDALEVVDALHDLIEGIGPDDGTVELVHSLGRHYVALGELGKDDLCRIRRVRALLLALGSERLAELGGLALEGE